MANGQNSKDDGVITVRHILKQHSIFSQWLILSIALIIISCILGLNIFLEYENTKIREQERLLASTKIIEENIIQNLIAIRDVLVDLRQHKPKGRVDKDLIMRLKTLSAALPGVRTLAILDASGINRASDRTELIGKNFSQRKYFKVPQQQPDKNMLYISPPFKTVLGVFTINVSVIIPGPKGEFAGVISATLDPSYFAPLLNSVLYSPDMRTSIIHWDGDIFMMIPARVNITGKSLAQPSAYFTMHKDSGQTNNVFTGTTVSTGEIRMVAFYTVKSNELELDKPLVVTSSRAPAGIFVTWYRNVLVQGILFSLFAFASIFGYYFYQRRQKQFSKQALEAANALIQSEERFRILMEMLPECVIVHQSGTIVYINPNGTNLLGISSPEEAIGRSIFDVIPPDMLDAARERVRKIEEEGLPAPTLEYKMRRFDGKTFIGEAIGNRIIFNNKPSTQVVIRDITYRKEEEEKLSQFSKELERSNKELDDFAYIASHDLKEPLRGIHNYSSFLLEDYADKLDNDGKDKLTTLVYLTKRLEAFINDLLKFSRVGRVILEITETAMDAVVKDTLALIKPLLEKEHIDVRIPRPLPAVKCDHFQMVEVLQNLMSNSVKYNDKPDKWIEIGYNDDKNTAAKYYVFYVRDNGIGIDKKYFDSIFTIFKRLHSRDMFGGGTGAGLTIVRKIIERHGGKIWLESIPGEGTTFYFTLQGE
jgi:PAS domain S-box-containing protein